MTQDEIEQKKLLLAMMGTIYGEAKKIDQNLVGASKDLRPTSDVVKNMFEGELRSTQLTQPPQDVQQPVLPPMAAPLPYLPPQQELKPVQSVDNSELVSTLKGIESNLAKLVEVFTQYEVKIKKKTNRKVSGSVVEDQRPMHCEGGKESDIVDSGVGGQHADVVRSPKPYE